ncbi:MAG TPA: signal recognition particle protein [bacterium]|nr:signal recognition particle protein [bacterium]
MFDRITDRLSAVFKKLTGRGKLTEPNVADALREVRVALLEADVNLAVVKEFLEDVREGALGGAVLGSLTPGQQFVGVVQRELTTLLGKNSGEFNLPLPATVMLVGLQGSGKTTTAAKLARWYTRHGNRRSLLAACDVQRPAAREQLEVLAERVGAEAFPGKDFTEDAMGTALAAMRQADRRNLDLTVVDTAGRLQIDEPLMAELAEMKGKLRPQAVFLVVDAASGQEALNVANVFHGRLGLDGMIVSKLDGDARGGCILSIAGGLGVPIRFVGLGETPDDLEPFDPDRLSRRILGLGDVVGLVEKARYAFDTRQAEHLANKAVTGSFDLEDFADQLRGIKKMGRMTDLLALVPGMRQFAREADGEGLDQGMKRALAIMDSMTPDERRHPNVIQGSRRRRIAAGSGTTTAEVNRLLAQYRAMAKAFDGLSGKNGRRMMRRLGIDPSKLDDALPPGL